MSQLYFRLLLVRETFYLTSCFTSVFVCWSAIFFIANDIMSIFIVNFVNFKDVNESITSFEFQFFKIWMSFINRFSIMRNFIIFIFCSMNYPLHNKKALISRLFIIPICQRFLGFYEQSNTLDVPWHDKIDVMGHFGVLLVCGNCSTAIFAIALFVGTYQLRK